MENWTLSNLPPEGHADVGRFFWDHCYQVSQAEKERLGLPARWLENHRLYRGGAVNKTMKNKHSVCANLIFANIQRTVANLTAKNPVAEAVSLDGGYLANPDGTPQLDAKGEPMRDDTDGKLSAKIKAWWNESEQNNSLVDSALGMETYGITIEKAFFDGKTKRGDIKVVDPFNAIVAPGVYDSFNDLPYVGEAYPERCDAIDAMFELEPGTVVPDTAFTTLGIEREDNRPTLTGPGMGPATSNYGSATYTEQTRAKSGDRALLVELWVRDDSTEEGTDEPIYPGGIRVITLTNGGSLVLSDRPNPNVNPAIPREKQANTFLFDNYPFWHAVSYRDTTCLWGFSAAEQVGDLAEKVSELLSRMYRYLARVMLPPLVLPQDTGLTIDDVNNNPGLVLTPVSSATSGAIRFVDVPSLPADTVRLYNMLLSAFDRVYQIEDADRGDTPNRIVAASAIVALQERNAVLMRHKIRSVDYLIRQRGRAAISFLQHFGVTTEPVKVDDGVKELRGTDLIGRKFAYVVESGSTIPQTGLMVKELAMDLAKMNRIDTEALLEVLQFPNYRRIIERMAETGGTLDAAAQAFIQAGIDPATIQELLAVAKQPQGAPGGMISQPPTA